MKEEYAKFNPAEGVERSPKCQRRILHLDRAGCSRLRAMSPNRDEVAPCDGASALARRKTLGCCLARPLACRRWAYLVCAIQGSKEVSTDHHLPILPPLQNVLENTPLGQETYLETAFGKPFTAAGFGNWFRSQCDEAGLPQCTAHGLRKIGAVRAAENGATEHELMALFGWDNARMARIYTRKAAQKKLAVSAAAKMASGAAKERAGVPLAVPPDKKLIKNSILAKKWLPGPDSNQRPSG